MDNVNERYLLWLMEAVGLAKGSRHSFYFLLCRRLYKTTYICVIDDDSDRVKDGRDLRRLYSNSTLEYAPEGPVSVLEVLAALAMRIDEWLSGGENGAMSWFLTMIHNLGLDGFTDDILTEPSQLEIVDGIVERFIRKEYAYDGTGGIFPLCDPPMDQRACTLEYQLQLYLKENRQLIGIDFG